MRIRIVAVLALALLIGGTAGRGVFAAQAPAAQAPAAEPTGDKQALADRLAKDLSGPDRDAAHAAADHLAALGPRAAALTPHLAAALGSQDAELRMRAARALAAIGPAASKAAPALRKAVADKDPHVRAHAARALGYLGDKDKANIDVLAAHFVDPDPMVRRASIRAIRMLNPGPQVTVPLVVKVLEDAEPSVVVGALENLAESGPEAVPALLEALKHPRARYWACLLAEELGPVAKEAVPELAKLLTVDEPEVRLQAALALGSIGPDARPALQPLLAALNDEQNSVHYAAILALVQMNAKEALPALAREERSDDKFLAMLATWAVAKLSPGDKQAAQKAVERIIASLKESDPMLRRGAARALIELEAPPEIVGPALIAALDDPDPAVQANVYGGLASLGEAAVPRIVERLKEPAVREKSLRILTAMGPQAKGAVPALVELLASDDVELRREVLFALAAIGPDAASATNAIVAQAQSDPDEVQVVATYALGKIGPEARTAVPVLRHNMMAEEGVVRLASVWALLQIQPKDPETIKAAIPLLTKAVTDAQTPLGRMEAAAALGDIGAAAKSAVPALKKALEDENHAVRDAAATALSKIEGQGQG